MVFIHRGSFASRWALGIIGVKTFQNWRFILRQLESRYWIRFCEIPSPFFDNRLLFRLRVCKPTACRLGSNGRSSDRWRAILNSDVRMWHLSFLPCAWMDCFLFNTSPLKNISSARCTRSRRWSESQLHRSKAIGEIPTSGY